MSSHLSLEYESLENIMPNSHQAKESQHKDAEREGSMHITSVNNDCIGSIFEYLELDDLLSVADSSKEFYTVVCQVFARKYKKTDLIYAWSAVCCFRSLEESDMTSREPVTFIEKPVIILKLLRNFGHLLKNLYINFRHDKYFDLRFLDAKRAEFGVKIESYLARYCSQSLHRLSLGVDYRRILFENLEKPLANVTALSIYFAKEQQLNLLQCIHQQLPQLKHIYIQNFCSPDLEHSEPMHFENIESFTIDGLSMQKFPFSFGKLKQLVFVNFDLNDEWCHFLVHLLCLSSLKMFYITNSYENLEYYPGTFDKMLKLSNLLLNLEELLIEVDPCMSPVAILQFLEQSRNSRILTLICAKLGKYPGHYKTEPIEKIGTIVKTVTSNLSSKWRWYAIDPFRHPFCNRKPCYCYVIERI